MLEVYGFTVCWLPLFIYANINSRCLIKVIGTNLFSMKKVGFVFHFHQDSNVYEGLNKQRNLKGNVNENDSDSLITTSHTWKITIRSRKWNTQTCKAQC